MHANHCGTSGAYGARLDCHTSRFVASEITLARYGQVFPEGLQNRTLSLRLSASCTWIRREEYFAGFPNRHQKFVPYSNIFLTVPELIPYAVQRPKKIKTLEGSFSTTTEPISKNLIPTNSSRRDLSILIVFKSHYEVYPFVFHRQTFVFFPNFEANHPTVIWASKLF